MSDLGPSGRDLFDRARREGGPSAEERERLRVQIEKTITPPHQTDAPPPILPSTAAAGPGLGGMDIAQTAATAAAGSTLLSRAPWVILALFGVATVATSWSKLTGMIALDEPAHAARSSSSASQDKPDNPSSRADASVFPIDSAVFPPDPAPDASVSHADLGVLTPDPTPLSTPAEEPRRPRPRPSKATRARVETSAPAEPENTLRAETNLLRRAQSARRAHRYDEALAALDEHRTSFRRGELANEREVVRALVTCERGDREEGQRLARLFAGTAWAASLQRACGEPSTDQTP